MANTVLQDIVKMAQLDVGLPFHPFFRRNFGHTVFRNMQQREALYAAVLEIYEGEGAKYIDPYPSETEEEARNKVGRFQLHLLMSFINKWNTLYTEEPTRVIEYDGKRLKDTDNTNTVLQEIYRRGHVNDVMEQADSLMRLTGVVALRPWFDADNEELVTHLYSANNIRPIENPNNPKRPHALALVGKYVQEESDGGAVMKHNAEFFTAEKWGRIENKKVVTEDSAYSEIPVALGWERYPTNKTGFFVPCPGPSLAAIDRLLANDFTSHLGFTTIMQGFGIPVTWGLAKGSKFSIGPDKTIDFDGDPDVKEDLEFKDPNAPLDEIGAVIDKLINWTRETFDIPKSLLDVSMSPSGVAQVEANAPLGLLRLRRAKQMRPLESSFLRKMVVVLQEAGMLDPGLDPNKFSVSVFYPEPNITKSTEKQIAEDRFYLEHGIISRADIYIREHPDQFDSAEEAEKYLSERALKLATDEADTGDEATPGSPADDADSPTLDGDAPSDGEDVQKEAMNGAQVSSMVEVVTAVSDNELAPEAAKIILRTAYPAMSGEDIDKAVNAAASFEKPKKETNNLLPPMMNGGEEEKETSDDRTESGTPEDE